MSTSIINSISEKTIPYKPLIAKALKSVTGAILLQQMMYWWKVSGDKPFYKFKQPCNDPAYTKGDSWCEELGFSRSEFDTALKSFASKIKRSDIEGIDELSDLVIYYTDMNRKTYYVLNIKSLSNFLENIYVKQDSALRKEGIPLYAKQDSCFIESGIPAFAYTEITTEITNNTTLSPENEKPAKSNFLSEEEIEELDSRSDTGFAEKEPPGSAPPPSQPTLLEI